jgi:hypothetical protein
VVPRSEWLEEKSPLHWRDSVRMMKSPRSQNPVFASFTIRRCRNNSPEVDRVSNVHKLIAKQLAKATSPTTGEVDVSELVQLVSTVYEEADNDR